MKSYWLMIEFYVFIGKYEVFFSIIDCWKIKAVLLSLIVGWKKEQLFHRRATLISLLL